MSMRALLRSATLAAYNAIGDIPESVTYVQTPAGGYDAFSGQPMGGTPISMTCNAIIVAADSTQDPSLEALQKKAASGDQFVYIRAAEITVVPGTRDMIIRPDGLPWIVKGFYRDPAEVMWVFLITKQQGAGT
jgi:hypothetical protein